MSISLRRLRYFRAIVAEGSFTAAAERLGIAQPALSQTMRKLEEHYGKPLLLRHKNGIEPTPEGEQVLAVAREVLDRLAKLDVEMRDRDSEARGTVTVAIAVTLARVVTPRLLTRMTERYPNVTVRIVMVASSDAMAMLKERGIDLAIAPMAAAEPRIATRPVYREGVCLTQLAKGVVPDTSPIRFKELVHSPLVQTSQRYDLRQRMDMTAQELGVTLNYRYVQDTPEAMLGIVMAGLAGLPTQVSIFHPTMERPLLDIRPIVEPAITRTHLLMRLADQARTLAETALEAELVASICDLADAGPLPGEAIYDGLWSDASSVAAG